VVDEDNSWKRSPLLQGPFGLFPPEAVRHIGSVVVRDAPNVRKRRKTEKPARGWRLPRQQVPTCGGQIGQGLRKLQHFSTGPGRHSLHA